MQLHIKKQSFHLGDFKRTGYTYMLPSFKTPAFMAYEAISRYYKLDEEALINELCGGISETEQVVHACLELEESAHLVTGFDTQALALVYGDDKETLHVYTLTSEDVQFFRDDDDEEDTVALVSTAFYDLLDELRETDDMVLRQGLRLAFAQLDKESEGACAPIVEYARAALG